MWNLSQNSRFPTRELGPVVGDDGVRHSKAIDNVGEKRHRLLRPEIRNGAQLHPFGEFVDRD
jgi:hypothetical protein